jgi:hypothetical protein
MGIAFRENKNKQDKPKKFKQTNKRKNNTDSTKPTFKYIFCTTDAIICRM